MRMKPTRSLFLGLCFMLALGFLYYSSWRISLWDWSHKALFDEQGFRLNLKADLPLNLVYKYGNLSEGACKPDFAAAKMTAIYPKFKQKAKMFLNPDYKGFSSIGDFSPPFGVKYQEKIIDSLLSATKNFGLGEELDRMSCRTCIVIGNGGILANKSLGQKIDEFDIVIRLNGAPLKGFEKDVGSKTTIRITYPEGAIQKIEHYESQSLFVLSAFKALDLKWMRHMIFNQELHSTEGFWKSVAKHVPRVPRDMRILNPYFIQEASFQLIGLPRNNGQMGRGNTATLGTVAITMALHNCDEVAVAGFGYNLSTPHAPLHYYEKTRMFAIKESWTHNIYKEKKFLIKLVKAGVIQDLTNGICGAGC